MFPSHRFLLAVLALSGLAVSAAAHQRLPGVPDAARPRYSHTMAGFQHFVADELPRLVEGEAFTWEGRRYEVVKLRSVTRHVANRWNPAHRDEAVPHRGRVEAILHVKIDGKLMRARIEGTADYVTLPDGWRWREVLLYLGGNESYDFVTGETR